MYLQNNILPAAITRLRSNDGIAGISFTFLLGVAGSDLAGLLGVLGETGGGSWTAGGSTAGVGAASAVAAASPEPRDILV